MERHLVPHFSLIFSSKNDELDFLNAAQVVHHCATIDPDVDVAVGRVATEDMKVGGQSSEGGEGKCNVCLPHSLVERPERERLCRRLYIHEEDERGADSGKHSALEK